MNWFLACLASAGLMVFGSVSHGGILQERVVLTRAHVDLVVEYAPGTSNELLLNFHDDDTGLHHSPTHVVILARSHSETVIPNGLEQLGVPGSPFWILPSSQNPELVHLGVSAEELPQGIFQESPRIRLLNVQAQGDFFVWQFDDSGGLAMRINSKDGITSEDFLQPVVGSHLHCNWGFSASGYFEVTFQVEGRLAGATTNLLSLPTTVVFAVEPLPQDPPAPAVLQNVILNSDSMVCELSGQGGVTYRIQTSSDLQVWSDRLSLQAGATPTPVTLGRSSSDKTVFVRAVAAEP